MFADSKLAAAGGLLWGAGRDAIVGAFSYGSAGVGMSSRAGARAVGELAEKIHNSCETMADLFKRAAYYAAPVVGVGVALSRVEISGVSNYPIKVSLNSDVDARIAWNVLGIAVGIQFTSVISKMISEQCHRYAGITLNRIKVHTPPEVPPRESVRGSGKNKENVKEVQA